MDKENAKVYVAVLLVRLIGAGMHILSKAAFDGGMSTFVFVFYRQLFGSLFWLPIAFVLERRRVPALPFMLCFKTFMLALFGIVGGLNVLCLAIDYTSAALSSASNNVIPVITFILAVFLRTEKVKLRRLSGIAKIAGVGLCIAGAVTIALYTGPHLKPLIHHRVLQQQHDQNRSRSHSKWVLGTFLMIISYTMWSLWVVLQGALLKEFPSQLLFTTLQCVFSTIQTFFVALAVERDFSRWKLAFDFNLLSVAYCGIMVAGVSFFLQSWTIQKRGPVFTTMTVPLTLIVTLILSHFILGELVHLGSILGGTLMIGGLYSVLWGKRRESTEGELVPAITAAKDSKTGSEEQAQ